MPDIIIVGGGAAGIIAAWHAASLGAHVLLLEKNDRLGLKILISGGGKCNLTHDGTMDQIRKSFRNNEGLFLLPSLYKFTNNDFLNILHKHGMRTYVRPDGRVFPCEPYNAKDVVKVLSDIVLEAGVKISYSSPVDTISYSEGDGFTISTSQKQHHTNKVILCTGGSSYPSTGTTGDGWRWAKTLGHTVVPLRAALAPIYTEPAYPEWSGVALRDVQLKARPADGGKVIDQWNSDVLFTHKGISGPSALGISRAIADYNAASNAQVALEIDLVPSSSYESLQSDFRKIIHGSPRKTVHALVDPWAPSRIVESIIQSSGIATDLRLSNIPAKSINRLIAILKGWQIGTVRVVPLERGEVVAGGVSLDEVDPKTMQSRIVPGLFLCGEILDIAGPVGGYNLQAAWSTGYVAGENAAK